MKILVCDFCKKDLTNSNFYPMTDEIVACERCGKILEKIIEYDKKAKPQKDRVKNVFAFVPKGSKLYCPDCESFFEFSELEITPYQELIVCKECGRKRDFNYYRYMK